jgi:DNA-binding transcriptional regulator YiaG
MAIDYKLLRGATLLSVEEFAKSLGINPETVKAWEIGSAAPDAMVQKKIFALVKKIAERGQ